MRVVVAARDIRVRRSLSSLLELDGNRIVAATDAPALLPELDADLGPDLVVLELGRRELVQPIPPGPARSALMCHSRAAAAWS